MEAHGGYYDDEEHALLAGVIAEIEQWDLEDDLSD